ncbi:MAG: phosphoglycerate mutase [Xanthomonadaceae bacterium]|nr:phosphoglycerate mutase [Xanthomonadaceae bacterium]
MTVRLLLPSRERLPSLAAGAAVARWLARADRLPNAEPGEQAQLQRQFSVVPSGWPLAALTRQMEAGDAGEHAWVRADPAHVRADLTAVRLLACGALGLDRAQADTLLRALQPLFDDAGWALSAPTPERWYLRLPRDSALPAFCAPERALGDEIHDLLPAGPEGRRWRSLLNEAQIVLHNHPLNAERSARGRLAVNSLWFFGAGTLPQQVATEAAVIASDDIELCAFAHAAGVASASLPPGFADVPVATDLIDLRHHRDAQGLARDWLLPLQGALSAGRVERVVLDFADGSGFALTPAQRWRFWRRSP